MEAAAASSIPWISSGNLCRWMAHVMMLLAAALPKGPPPPRPANLSVDPRDWAQDHSPGPQPVRLCEDEGRRRMARVAGPLLQNGAFEGPKSHREHAHAPNDMGTSDSDVGSQSDGSSSHSRPSSSGEWKTATSDTALVLEGPNLWQAKEHLFNLPKTSAGGDSGCLHSFPCRQSGSCAKEGCTIELE